MDARATEGLLRFFDMKDHRSTNVSHQLHEIIAIAIMAVFCGMESWSGVESWAQIREPWLTSLLGLKHGIPSHDTFDRVFSRIDPLAFERCFQQWTGALVANVKGLFIAVDGKTARRSWKRAWSKTPVHLVSAFVQKNQLILGQLATDCKSNEITAIPKLLALLDLAGHTVTIDAMGTQREIAAEIVKMKAHYVLAVKDNQPKLNERVMRLMDEGLLDEFAGMEHGVYDQSEEGHGRAERRRVWVTTEVNWLGEELLELWPGLASIVMVERWRQDYGNLEGAKSYERHYYISDHSHTDASFFAEAIRSHWGVESMHWSLDVSMNEDQCRLRTGNGAENFSRLRRMALNKLNNWHPKKPSGAPLNVGIKIKQQMCGWDNECLLKVLLT